VTINLPQNWDTVQGTESAENETPKVSRGGVSGGIPLPSRLGGLGSVISSPSGIRGTGPAENGYDTFWALTASDDIEFGIGIRPVSTNSSTWHYITFKVGQNQDGSEFSIPGNLVIFPGQAIKIWHCPGKIGTDGHLNYQSTQTTLF